MVEWKPEYVTISWHFRSREILEVRLIKWGIILGQHVGIWNFWQIWSTPRGKELCLGFPIRTVKHNCYLTPIWVAAVLPLVFARKCQDWPRRLLFAFQQYHGFPISGLMSPLSTLQSANIEVLLHFSLSVKAVTLIFISGRALAISSTHEGKTGNINGKTEFFLTVC